MPEIEWTNEWIMLASGALLLALLVGYLLASMLQGRERKRLLAQWQEQVAANEAQQQQLHTQALAASQTQAALENARATEEWLHADVAEGKQEISALSQRLEKTRTEAEDKARQFETIAEKARGLEAQLQRAEERVRAEQENHSKLLVAHQHLNNQFTELKTTLARREEYFVEQKQQLTEARAALTKEFEVLANKIFEEKGKTFTHASQTHLDNLLRPFRQQIEGFQKRVNEVHDASLKDSSSLAAEIKKVLEVGLAMSAEATNLTKALKGDSQQRGAWGEAQLQRTLEMSGLIQGEHYTQQNSFRDAEGRTKQTDFLIQLPGAKQVVIDSKVTLNAYDRLVSADTKEERAVALREHVAAVRKHIDDLASKDYANLPELDSPSFVLLFMPIEAAYIEALKAQKGLFDYGYEKGVIVVSHTTLIPVLRTIANLWMIDRGNKEARAIGERAGDIYNQVRVLAERLSGLGTSLSAASNHYNRTVTALVGQQGLYGKVERFDALSTKVNKELPDVQMTHLDFETERMAALLERPSEK